MPLSEKKLSVKTSAALDIIGYGLRSRDETKQTALIVELIDEYFWEAKIIVNGGRAEGTALSDDSDADGMFVIRNMLVFDGEDERKEIVMCISAVRTGCYPGYCKLILSDEQHSNFEYVFDTQEGLLIDYDKMMKCIKKVKGKFYISSAVFTEAVIPEGLIPADKFGKASFEKIGPAIRNNGVDRVFAFKMNKWPKEAVVWSNRQRNNNWPSRECINHLKANVSCYVVGVGNKMSQTFDIEWRLSFAAIERELIWSMNETQFKCYIIIKHLKEEFGSYPALEQITTYHMKNIMFWICEELTAWNPSYLLTNVKKCLQKLEKCMLDGKLSHYIIPENNLFKGKTFSTDKVKIAINDMQRKELIDFITNICEADKALVISPEVCGYSNNCTNACGNVHMRFDREFKHIFFSKFPTYKILLPCIQIAQAKAYWRNELHVYKSISDKPDSYSFRLAKSVIELIKKGEDMDFATSTINVALVYFMHDMYDEVQKVLEPLLSNEDLKTYPAAAFEQHSYVCFKTNKMQIYRNDGVNNIQDLTKDRNNLVNDFCTRFQDIFETIVYDEHFYAPTLPYPFALQICILRSPSFVCKLNPVVVCYYLLYMSRLKLGQQELAQETLQRLRLAVYNNRERRDYYFSLALLGHCLYWTGDIEGAYESYSKSIKIRESVLNISVYLMAFLINDWYTNKCSELF